MLWSVPLSKITIEVVSTPRRTVNPVVKLSAELLSWMAAVKDMAFESTPLHKSTDHYDNMELPSLPHLKYRKRLDSLSLCCAYMDSDGIQRTHQETISHKKVDLEVVAALLPPAIVSIQTFLAENHNEVAQADEAPAAEVPLMADTDSK